MSYKVQGTVAPGYEPVRDWFQKDFNKSSESNSQLCVYVKGEKVVDLWGSTGPNRDPKYGPDSLQQVFSSTKAVAAVCMACLVDRGFLDYDALVSKYWPEFGTNGREDLKVKDVLRHEAGMPYFRKTIKVGDLLPPELKKNAVGKIIEEEESPIFPPEKYGTKREYHSATRGYILNEIFRRTDPQGRTMGEFLREELAAPLEADVVIGLLEPDLEKVSDVHGWGLGSVMLQGCIPAFMGRKFVPNTLDIVKGFGVMKPFKERGDPPPPVIDALEVSGFSAVTRLLEAFNGKSVRMGESPSFSGHCSARGLAKIAACMASKGQMVSPDGDGPRVMSEEAWEKMHAETKREKTAGLGLMKTTFSQGGVCFFQADEEFPSIDVCEGFVGWGGWGGSVFQWHPELEMGYSYVPTLLHWFDLFNGKSVRLQKVAAECARKIQESKK